ncbi:hypothetical protein fugu_010123 [Takifugu bimaculatus]|uniref:MRH domain-containing protein n=1 Tax=Takifugu bimaculatus TaxID=433685 RepID=A0A4Z2CEK3_9TELE|nr:hypothetical protein fugu_010123 [Takifugu bimaculatus]
MKMVNSYTRGSLLMWALALWVILDGGPVCATNSTQSCKLRFDSDRKVLSQLEPLAHQNFSGQSNNENYTYVFQLCGDAGGIPGAGVIQIDNKKKDAKPTVIGTYNFTQAIGESNWVVLTYTYNYKHGSCSKDASRAQIMIFCNREVDESPLHVIQENSERENHCLYLFRLDSSAVCPALQSKLSAGSIILIIGFCLLTVYLVGGFLYQRMIVGAKGMEQFPNYAFWVEVGNLAADGCDFVCRSRTREEVPTYRGVSSEPSEDDPEERDDHLLPM